MKRSPATSFRRLLHQSVLAVGALAGFFQTYAIPLRVNRGPEGQWWETVRRLVAGTAGAFDSRAGPRPITEAEYAGSLHCSLEETEELLYRCGFVRNPTARLKTRNGTPEVGSWAYRESPLAPRQLHLMLFDGANGEIDIYAHEELSSVNPLCGAAHFTGVGQSVGAGVRRARDRFPLNTADALENPPDSPWNRC